jgi:sn-glycerol 3-phosphate transport system permease protein
MKAMRAPARLVVEGLWYFLLGIVSLLILFPLLTALTQSLLSDAEISSYPPRLVPSWPHFASFGRALAQAPLLRYLVNSTVQSTLVTLGQLTTASSAAFAFAFLAFRARHALFIVFLATLMVPWEATIIPNYLLIRSLHWTDTFLGLASPFLGTAFGTFLIRQSMLTLPRELRDAAGMDGCGNLRFLLTIALPLTRPALGTLAVYSFLQTWNQYLWPLLITNNHMMRTVQIGITLLQDEERFMLNTVMAGVVIILAPTVAIFILGNRQLIRGLTAGAVKG